MGKILKIILSLFVILISSLTSLITIACSNIMIDPYVEIFNDYYNQNPNNPYLNFYNNTSNILKSSVSETENQKFNALYDDGTSNKTWNDFTSLESDLTTTKLSSTVKLNIDWVSMYNNVKLNQLDTSIALKQQLRFYNILAKLYQKSNVLKLLQWVRPAPQQEGNVVAYNQYYPGVNSQTQTFGPMFANIDLINNQYHENFWSSDAITSVSTHEYGHALSNFFGATNNERNRFNTTYIDIGSVNQNIRLNKLNKVTNSSFSDRTQVLINFLDKDAVTQGIVKLNNEVENFLFAVLAVSSKYSHIAWQDDNINQRDEFFAEAFAYWMLTPENLRNISWGLLNDFFIDYVPVFYHL